MEIDLEPTTLLERFRAFIRHRIRTHVFVVGVLLVILGALGFFVLRIEDVSLTRTDNRYPTDTYATAQLQEALRDLLPGRISWNPPLSMEEGVDYLVEARLLFNVK